MAHEITKTDSLLLYKERAWHGLGDIVTDVLTAKQAILTASMDWKVDRRQLYTKQLTADGTMEEVVVPTHVANYRSDTQELLGIVSANYSAIDNLYLADFCDALGGENTVKVESVGSVRGGKRVWILMQGDSFEIGNGDQIFTYLLASNGHDGLTAFRLTPTSVRVVCSNTLHMCVPREDDGAIMNSAMSLKHTTNVMERVEEARLALKQYRKTTDAFRGTVEQLQKAPVSTDGMKEFFWECYQRDFGTIPAAGAVSTKDVNARNRAMDAFGMFSKRFDDEISIAGASKWNCFNAYSGLIQHDKKGKGKNDALRVDSRVESNLFGLNSERTQRAWATILAQ